MDSLRIPLEHTLEARLEALALLQQESLPGLPYSTEDAARQALVRGVDLMLAEFLGGRHGHAGVMGEAPRRTNGAGELAR